MGLRARAAIRVVQAVTQAPHDAEGIATTLARALTAELGVGAVVALAGERAHHARRGSDDAAAADGPSLEELPDVDGPVAPAEAAALATRFGHAPGSRVFAFPLREGRLVFGRVLLFRDATEEDLDASGVDAVRACVEHAELALAHAASARARSEAEERLRSVLTAARGGIWELDFPSGTLSWDEGFRELHGFPPEAVPQPELWRTRVHPDDLVRIESRLDSELAARTPSFQQTFRILHPERGVRHVLDLVRTVTSGEDALLRAGGITLDVTELVAAQAAQADLASRLRAAEIAGGVGTYDVELPTGNTYFSEGMRVLFGYPSDHELTRDEVRGRLNPLDRVEVPKRLEEAAETGNYRAEYRLELPDGTTRWLSSRGEVTRDADRNPRRLLGVLVDVTARKEAEQTLAEAVRLRDEFLQVASHELRTPLTALRLQIESMEHLVEGGSRIEKKVSVATRQIERLSVLTEALLDVTRIASGRLELEREPVDLEALAAEVVERFTAVATNAGSSLRLELGGRVAGTWDRARLDQVLTNLVSNALKYGGGKPVVVTVRAEDEDAVLEVRDEGIGIPERDQARVFDRFARGVSAAHYGGLGLGLYIARELVEAHGGTIAIRSVPGEGAAFLVRLPRAAPAPKRESVLTASS